MIVTIDNYKFKCDIEIYRLSDTEIITIKYENLNVNNNLATINTFDFKEDTYRIQLNEDIEDEINLIYKFYDKNNLIFEENTIDCCIKIENENIMSYDVDNFLDLYEEKVIILDKFNTKQWNLYWYYLHWFTFNYTNKPSEDDKNEVNKLVYVMKTNGIKCDKCRMHFKEWLNKYDIHLYFVDRKSLFKYFFELHNNINRQNGKKVLSLNQAVNIYRKNNWTLKLDKYGVNIIKLFKDRKLETFPNLFYTLAEENLKKEFEIV